MKCNFNRLIAYLNSELSENQNHDVAAHLRDCDICLEAVSTILQDRSFESQFHRMSPYKGADLPSHANGRNLLM
ncbi:MAG TPA: zf-HC2 domain-containing protein [Acidobacteriota bacterium]|nr:zf-HC2 domain-containing protein [Acidobacteriota bacterium]